jgi:hypothetical protein
MARSIKTILNGIRKDAERPVNLAMLVTFEWPVTPDDWVGHYGTITATLAEYVSRDKVDPLSSRGFYGESESTRDLLRRLELTGQFHSSGEGADPTNVYGWQARFSEARFISLWDAEFMAEVLSGLGKAIDATAKKIGQAQTYGQWLAYAADAIGITDIVTDATCYHPEKRRKATDSNRFSNGYRFWRHAPSDIAGHLNYRLAEYAEWLKARRTPAESIV